MKNRLSYDFVYYILGIVASILIWYLAFNLVHFPKSYETLRIFYAGEIKEYSFSRIVLENIDEEHLEKVELVSSKPTDSSFATKYNVVCFTSCDVAIVPISILEQTACSTAYEVLDNKYENESFIQENQIYGIVLNEKNIQDLSPYFHFLDEDYAITVISSSVNCGSITNNCYLLLDFLLGYENI